MASRMWMIPTRAPGIRPWCGALTFLLVAVGILGCAEPKPEPLPEAVWRMKVYQAKPDEVSLAGSQLLLLVTFDQYKWRGQRDDPEGGFMLGSTMGASAEDVVFDVTFKPEPEPDAAVLEAVTVQATSDRFGRICMEIPKAVAQYALKGVGARVALRSTVPDEPGLLLTREVRFDDPDESVIEFSKLSLILLEGGGEE